MNRNQLKKLIEEFSEERVEFSCPKILNETQRLLMKCTRDVLIEKAKREAGINVGEVFWPVSCR